jgi:hypothetical protein
MVCPETDVLTSFAVPLTVRVCEVLSVLVPVSSQNALYNWLGERIEEWEEENDKEYDEFVLKINIDGLEEHLIDSVEYDWTCVVNIEPSRIVDVIEM